MNLLHNQITYNNTINRSGENVREQYELVKNGE